MTGNLGGTSGGHDWIIPAFRNTECCCKQIFSRHLLVFVHDGSEYIAYKH